jgi:hypothetical protein
LWSVESNVMIPRRRARVKRVSDIKVADPVAYVLSLNLHRRHLTPSQRAMIGARAREVYDQMAKERKKQHAGTAPGKKKNTPGKSTGSDSAAQGNGDARELVGRTVGACGSLIDWATKVLDKGVPELAKAVDEGRMRRFIRPTCPRRPA